MKMINQMVLTLGLVILVTGNNGVLATSSQGQVPEQNRREDCYYVGSSIAGWIECREPRTSQSSYSAPSNDGSSTWRMQRPNGEAKK